MQRIRILLVLILMVAGFVIVALPDRGSRLFSISVNHGSSLQDFIGLLLFLVPYIYMVSMSWKKTEKFRKYQNSSVFFIWTILIRNIIWHLTQSIVCILRTIGLSSHCEENRCKTYFERVLGKASGF